MFTFLGGLKALVIQICREYIEGITQPKYKLKVTFIVETKKKH